VLRAARFGIFFRHEEAPKKEAKRRWSRRDGLAKQVKGQPCDDFAQMPLRVFISAAFFRSLPSGYPSAVFASPHVRVCFAGKWMGLLLWRFRVYEGISYWPERDRDVATVAKSCRVAG
jgi:hypothetical protein